MVLYFSDFICTIYYLHKLILQQFKANRGENKFLKLIVMRTWFYNRFLLQKGKFPWKEKKESYSAIYKNTRFYGHHEFYQLIIYLFLTHLNIVIAPSIYTLWTKNG